MISFLASAGVGVSACWISNMSVCHWSNQSKSSDRSNGHWFVKKIGFVVRNNQNKYERWKGNTPELKCLFSIRIYQLGHKSRFIRKQHRPKSYKITKEKNKNSVRNIERPYDRFSFRRRRGCQFPKIRHSANLLVEMNSLLNWPVAARMLCLLYT